MNQDDIDEVEKLPFTPGIRVTPRAVILDGTGKKILLLHKAHPERGYRFALPGGAEECGETLMQTL
ncbi:MAG: hypothetical protein HQL48_09910, partial [Gammaproteobacteria bacterium]|nr:hypothetical protein [Gammaproteobacteria bacterium]